MAKSSTEREEITKDIQVLLLADADGESINNSAEAPNEG